MTRCTGPIRMLARAAAFAVAVAFPVFSVLADDGWRPDPLTPTLGLPGYDTISAAIALDLDIPGGAILSGRADISATATEPLDRIGFDLRNGLEVDSATVNGEAARFRHANDDLEILLPAPAARGDALAIEVAYHGVPGTRDDPYQRGWWSDGKTLFIIGEPGGAEAWFPVNNEPADAALWTLSLTVPAGIETVAGGAPSAPVAEGDRVTTTWTYDDPVAPYLLTFAAGDFEIVHRTTPGGIAITLALPPDLAASTRQVFDDLPDMLDYFSQVFGPYPGHRFGGAVVDGFGGALETEEMVIFGRSSVTPETVAHELAHQWFGNSVRLESWSDIWLNEAFGRYAEILWTEHEDGIVARDAALQDLAAAVRRHAASDEAVPVASPTAETMFSGDVYNRGALTLHALRTRLGDDAFFRLLRAWNGRYRNQAAGTPEFIALASEIAGEDLTSFFDEWLYRVDLPGTLLAPAG